MRIEFSRHVEIVNHNHTCREISRPEAHDLRMGRAPVTEVMKEMGGRLRAIREAVNQTQDAFALIAGVGVTTISGWESGRNQIDLVALARLADTVGFTTDWVARGDMSGLRFDLAMTLQAHIRRLMDGEPKRRGRPRNSQPSQSDPPIVRDAPGDPPKPPRREMHAPVNPYTPPPKFT